MQNLKKNWLVFPNMTWGPLWIFTQPLKSPKISLRCSIFVYSKHEVWAKKFADDTSLFSVALDINTSAIELNSGLKKINDWAFQWKMTFNSGRRKQAQEIIFSKILKKATHPLLLLNNNKVSQVNAQAHPGVILDVNIWRAFGKCI